MSDTPSRIAPDPGAPRPFDGENLVLACHTYCALCGHLLEIGEAVTSRKATPREPWRVACSICVPIVPHKPPPILR